MEKRFIIIFQKIISSSIYKSSIYIYRTKQEEEIRCGLNEEPLLEHVKDEKSHYL